MQIQISWFLQTPPDLDLHCLQRQHISGFSRTRVKITQNEDHSTIKTSCSQFQMFSLIMVCPKILYTKVSDKMAYTNSVDPDQTAPLVWSVSTLLAILLSILRDNCIKANFWPKKYGMKYLNFRNIYCILYSILTHCSLETPKKVMANSADQDQTAQNVASDQGLHCLQIVRPFFSQNI